MKLETSSFDVLGVRVGALNLPRAVDTIEQWIRRRTPHYVCVTGVHGVTESRRDPELRRIFKGAGMVTPDGMPLVWLGRLQGYRDIERVYGPDLMLALCARKGLRHFLYGGSPTTLVKLERNLRRRFPGIAIVGTISPPFRALTPAEDGAIAAAIDSARPDIVWVGVGTPKQERWMAEHVDRLGVPALIGVGAAFDFHAGTKAQAPIWMRRSGLEWVFRFLCEPRRLARRYLVGNTVFVSLLLTQLVRPTSH